MYVYISYYLFGVHGSDSLVSTGSVLRRGGALHVADYQTKHLLATSPSWNTCQCLRRGVCHGRLRQAHARLDSQHCHIPQSELGLSCLEKTTVTLSSLDLDLVCLFPPLWTLSSTLDFDLVCLLPPRRHPLISLSFSSLTSPSSHLPLTQVTTSATLILFMDHWSAFVTRRRAISVLRFVVLTSMSQRCI